MKTQTNTRILSQLDFYVRISSISSFLVGVAVQLGWVFGIAALKNLLPGLATMKPLTALGLLLAAVALWLLQKEDRVTLRRQWGSICAALVVSIGGMVLLEYLFNFNIGIDQWLFHQAVLAEGGLLPGRPAPATALCLFLLGLALLSMDRKSKWLTPLVTIPILLIGALAIVGYVYGVSSLYKIGPYTSMALHTAILLIILALGVLSARPEHPFVAVLTSDWAGGGMARRLVFTAILIEFVLGWLR